MTQGDLAGVTFLGRPIKPLALALAMSMATIFWFNIVANSGVLVESAAGDFVGYVAGASSVLLFAGWWGKSQTLAETGLLLSAGVWITRAATILLMDEWNSAAFFLSLGWVTAAVGAYLLEAFDPACRILPSNRKRA